MTEGLSPRTKFRYEICAGNTARPTVLFHFTIQ
jgi:hypothetical protein